MSGIINMERFNTEFKLLKGYLIWRRLTALEATTLMQRCANFFQTDALIQALMEKGALKL